VSEPTPRPAPPAWPAKGTAEYDERIARMRAGHAARVQKAAQKQQEARTAPPVGEPELIDVGEPSAARMAPEPRQDARGKPAAKKGKSEADLDEKKAREYLGMFCRWAATHPGHEHWHRDDDELEMVTVPGVRCYNRLDRKLREQMQSMSDPAALIFGLVVVFGPSIAQEIRSVRTSTQRDARPQARQQRPAQPQPQQPQGEADGGFGGYGPEYSAAVSSNGAVGTPIPADIPLTGF
jgi:hypothetical protein